MTSGGPPSRAHDPVIATVKVSFTRSYLLPAADGYLLIDTTYAGRFDELSASYARRASAWPMSDTCS